MGLADLFRDTGTHSLSGHTAYPTQTGRSVSEESALEIAAVFDAVRVISSTIASLPLITFRRRQNGDGKERATNHWAFKLLKQKPNPLMSSFDLRMMLHSHLELWGNAYAVQEKDGQGRVKNLWPIPPGKIKRIIRDDEDSARLTYEVERENSKSNMIPGRDMLHVRLWQVGGIKGISTIRKAAETLGIAKASREFGSRFFDNDARPGGVIIHPGQLSEEAYQRMKKSWQENNAGVEKAHGIEIMEEGVEFQEIGMPPEDAQMIQAQKFSVTEIARFFNMPPHKIKDLERSTFSNIESQNIEYVTDSVRPRTKRWEQAYQTQLLDGQNTFFAEHQLQGLMRGNSEARTAIYNSAIQNGWMTPNQVRKKENMNPVEGGDRLFIQENLTPVDRKLAGKTEEEGNQEMSVTDDKTEIFQEIDRGQFTGRERLEVANRFVDEEMIPLFEEAIERERRQLRSILSDKEQVPEFFSEAGSFLFGDQLPYLVDKLREPMSEMNRQIFTLVEEELGEDIDFDLSEHNQEIIRQQARNSVASTQNKLTNVRANTAESENQFDAIGDGIENMEQGRAEREANDRTKDSMNATTIAGFAASAVVVKKIWTADADNCPACTSLNGQVVGVNSSFAGGGEDITGGGWSSSSAVTRPPLHRGCDCFLLSQSE